MIFALVAYFNPRYRVWRRANACFGTAGLLAFIPTFAVKANLVRFGAIKFVSESSPIVVLGFLGAGLFLAWVDSRKGVVRVASSATSSKNTNLNVVNSRNAVVGLTTGGDVTINQGVSEETLLALLENQRLPIETRSHATDLADHSQVDVELLWRLVDDIKSSRKQLEREQTAQLASDLTGRFERFGESWPAVLRSETLLILAEEERSRIAQARNSGIEVDLSRLRNLLKELHDVGA